MLLSYLTMSVAFGFARRVGLSSSLRNFNTALSDATRYTIADQPKRFANAKKENNVRVLDIDKVYAPNVKDKVVLVTGEFD